MSGALDRLVEQDTFAEMVALLKPVELIIACLRLEDLADDQIASLLDIDRSTVHAHMEQALQRIVEALPELDVVLRDRRHPPQRGLRPLARGWVCSSKVGESQSVGQLPARHEEERGAAECGSPPSHAACDEDSRAIRRPPGRCQ